MSSDASGTSKPVGIALVPCDNIYMDSSGKQALVGLFNRVVVPEFPAVKARMCIYASITDVYPNTRCKVDIVHGETDEPVFVAEGPMDDDEVNPVTICDLIFELNNIVFKEAGTYYVRLFGNDQILLQRPFELIERRPKREGEQE